MRDSTKGILIGVLGTLVLVAAACLAWWVGAGRGVVLTDGARIRIPVADAPVREVLWEPADLLPDWINSGEETYEPRVTPRGDALLLVRGKAGGSADLFVAQHTEAGWSEPTPLAAVNTPLADELGPCLSADGRTLYFYSDREGGQGGYDLWRISRTDDPALPLAAAAWGEAENLGPAVNSLFNDYGPALTPAGDRLFFASNRPRDAAEIEAARDNWPATVREEFERRDYDLFAAPLTDRGPGQAERLSAISTSSNEGTPAISPAGDFLYFASDRPGGAGGLDIYRSRLIDGAITPPEALGWPINTAANELDPAVSMHGFALHFSSNRTQSTPDHDAGATPPTPDPAPARYAIYSTLSREVFRERDPVLASFDWGAAWNAVWPWLLLLGLLLLLLALLRRFLRDEQMKRRWRTLSLLAKCLILSLMLHAMLGALFTVWYVAGTVGEALRNSTGGGTRVALVSRAIGSDLAAQVRGGLTDLTVEAQTPTESRAAPELETQARMVEARFDAQRIDQPDTRVDLAPAIQDSAIEVASPSPATPTIDTTAAPTTALATPDSSAAQPASESQLAATAQPSPVSATQAALPASSNPSPASIQVERSQVADAALQSAQPTATSAPQVPIQAPGPATSVSVAVDAPRSTVATPSVAASQAVTESQMAVRPESGSATSTRPASDSLPQVATSATAALAPTPTQPSAESALSTASLQTALDARPTIADQPGAAVSTVAAIPGAAPVSTATPATAPSSSTTEAGITIEMQSAALAPATPGLAPDPASSPSTRPLLAPAPAGPAAESTLPSSDSAATAASSSPAAPGPASSPVQIPAATTAVQTALPLAGSAARSAAEQSLAIAADRALESTLSPARPAATPGIPAGLDRLEVALPAATIDDSTPIPAAATDAASASVPAEATGSTMPAIDVAPSTAQLAVALPEASASGLADEASQPPSRADAPALEQARPSIELNAPASPTAPAILRPEHSSPVADGHLEAASAIAQPDASRASTQPMPATPAIPIDLSSLPVPSLALPEATDEPPAQALEPIGTLAGIVRDSETGEPINGARIRLDLPDAPPLVARSNSRGQYRLRIPADIPDNVAITATAPGYTPASINVALDEIVAAERRSQPLARDFDLSPLAWDVIPIEDDPEVHHLGNDEFEGAINSQFQRSSEGLTYLAEFDLGRDQVYPAIRAAELVILAKGAQANNPIRINGRELDGFIVDTPADGSFGELVFRVPPRWLREGANTIEVFSVRGSNDLDDFEFVNPRIRLRPSQARDDAAPDR